MWPDAARRAAALAGAAVRAVVVPTSGAGVARVGDLTSAFALRTLLKQMQAHPDGARILRERPIVTSASIDVPRLLQLPPDTLGRRYAEFMSGHGFEADGRPGVEHIANEDAAYVMLRYRQCHDFYHALTGLPISILGELGQKAFEYRCTGLPVGMLAVLGGSVRLSSQQRRVLVEQLLPWALTQRLTVPLLCVYWEELLHVPVPVLRVRLGMLPPPDLALL